MADRSKIDPQAPAPRAGSSTSDGAVDDSVSAGPNSTSPGTATLGVFDRDTAVQRVDAQSADAEHTAQATFTAEVSPDWRAGRGPHGGYLAAILLRALIETVADPARVGGRASGRASGRAPRSLTIHYARAPEPGPVSIRTTIEREGRSLSTLSARMEQDGSLLALVLAAFSVPWSAQEINELEIPEVAPPDPVRESGRLLHPAAPPFTRQLVLQPRMGAVPFTGSPHPMEIGGWLGLVEERPIDALSLAFFSDALFSPPFIRLTEPAATPTIDLTVHFRTPMPRLPDPDPAELCLARFSSGLVHEGFFEEDGVIWAADGTVLIQSRQLGIVLPITKR